MPANLKPSAPWRSELTEEERVEVQALEQKAVNLDSERKGVTHKLNLIRNRAVQRHRYRIRKLDT